MIIDQQYIDYSDTSVRYEFVLYLRVSDTKQTTDGSGLLSQETRGREYAKQLGFPVVEKFIDDGISGKFKDRPDVKRMLAFLKQKKAGVQYVVLIDDISRLARDVRVHFDLRDALDEVGALLDSPTMRFKVKRDADGNMSEGIQALTAQHYREKVAETTRHRTWARLMAGYWVYTAPVGYKYVKTKAQGKVLVRDEPVASIIQEALEGYASGHFATQTEVRRFFESKPEFPKQLPNGKIRLQKVSDIMSHPYYLCHTKGCDSYGKSIRRTDIEGDFSNLLKQMRPNQNLFHIIKDMVFNAYNQRTEQIGEARKSLKREILKLEKQIDGYLDKADRRVFRQGTGRIQFTRHGGLQPQDRSTGASKACNVRKAGKELCKTANLGAYARTPYAVSRKPL